MNTCETCKHWIRLINNENVNRGECHAIRPQRESLTDERGASIRGGIAKGHRKGVTLITGGLFTCGKFEPR